MALDLRGNSSGGSTVPSGANTFKYLATNYTALLSATSSLVVEVGTLAYVYNEQGTKWLPGTIGGTYYPNGFYVYDGSNWIADRNNIASQLQESINDILAIENDVSTIEGQVVTINGQILSKLDKPTVTNISSASYSVLITDSIINITSNTCTITLPNTNTLTDNKEFTFYFNDCNLTLVTVGSDLVDGENMWTLQNSGSFNVSNVGLNNYRIS